MSIKVYVSGPMTGMQGYNFDAFNEAEAQLRDLGYEVENPAKFGHDESLNWYDCMRRDIPLVMECDAVVTLYGSWNSKGSKLECDVARGMDIPVYDLISVLENPPYYRTRIREAQDKRRGTAKK